MDPGTNSTVHTTYTSPKQTAPQTPCSSTQFRKSLNHSRTGKKKPAVNNTTTRTAKRINFHEPPFFVGDSSEGTTGAAGDAFVSSISFCPLLPNPWANILPGGIFVPPDKRSI